MGLGCRRRRRSPCSPRPAIRPRAAAMAPRHEAPRLPGLGQTQGGAQEKPIELPAVVAVVAAAAAGAAAAQADDAWARRGRGPRGRRWQMTSGGGEARQHGVCGAE